MENNIDILISAKDMATKTIQGVQKSIDNTTWSVSNFLQKNQQGMQTLQRTSAVALAGVVALGVWAVSQASKMQDLRQSFDTLTGSAEKGKKLFMDIQNFASKTPYDTEQLARATSTMLGFGVSQEKVMDSMKMLGDISLGNGDRLQSLSLAFAQMSSTGRLMGQDLLQMVNAGFNPLQIISQKTGESMVSLKEKMADGLITTQMVEDAMKDATTWTGRYAGGMEKASKTFSWVMSTFRDNIGITLASMAGFANGEMVKGGLLDQLTQAMEKAMPYLDRFAKWASQNGTTIGVFIGITWAVAGFVLTLTTLGLVVPNFIAGLLLIKNTFLAVKAGALLLQASLWPIGWAMLAIGAITALVALAWNKNFFGIQEKTKFVVDWLRWKLEAFWAWIYPYVQMFLKSVSDFWAKWGESIKAVFVFLFNYLKNYIAFFFNVFTGDWEGAWQNVKNVFGDITNSIIEQAKVWGWNLINTIIDGIKAKYEAFKGAILGIAGIIGDYLGFHSPTKEWPGKDADKWMPNLITMLISGIDGGRSALETSANELAKIIGKGFSKEHFATLKENLVSFMEKAKSVWDQMGTSIDNQSQKIKWLKDEYKALKEQMKEVMGEISDVWNERTSTLAGRAQEIQKEIAELRKKDDKEQGDYDRVASLEKELQFIKDQWITEAEINTARDLANRSEAQVIVDRFAQRTAELEDKKLKILEEMQAKKEQIADETLKYKAMVDYKKKMETEYRALTNMYFKQQLSETQQLISAMRQLESARRAAQGPMASWARALGWPVTGGNSYLVGERWPELFTPSQSGSITPNNKLGGGVTISINMGGVSVRSDNDIPALARAIKDELTRDVQLSRLGIA